jgi:hypothetical protein
MDLFDMLSWILCPLAFYALYGKIRKNVSAFLFAVWFANFAVSMWQIFSGRAFVGLPDNINWQAALVLGTTPFALNYARLKLRSNREYNPALWTACIIIAAFLALTLMKTKSRAAFISLAFASILYLFLKIGNKKLFLRTALLSILTTGCVFGGLILFSENFSAKVSGILFNDIRPTIWAGAVNMTKDYLFFGVGEPSFQSAFMPYRPIGYFLRSHHFAHITDHPHNHILYIFACFGVVAGFLYLILLFYPIYISVKKYKSLSSGTKTVFFSFVLLLICSFFDKTYFEWHTLFIMNLLLGLLWFNAWPKENYARIPDNKGKLVRYVRAAAGCLILVFFAYTNYISWFSSVRYVSAVVLYDNYSKPASALSVCGSALRKEKLMASANFAAAKISLQNFKDPYMTEHFIKILEESPTPSYARSNLIMANAQALLGRKLAAISYLEKDLRNYPISIESLYKKAMLEKSIGRTEDMEQTLKHLDTALAHKGLSYDDIPYILTHNSFDNKFSDYKKLKEQGLNKSAD